MILTYLVEAFLAARGKARLGYYFFGYRAVLHSSLTLPVRLGGPLNCVSNRQ